MCVCVCVRACVRVCVCVCVFERLCSVSIEMLMDADVIGLFWFCSVIFCNYSSRDILKQRRLKKNAI